MMVPRIPLLIFCLFSLLCLTGTSNVESMDADIYSDPDGKFNEDFTDTKKPSKHRNAEDLKDPGKPDPLAENIPEENADSANDFELRHRESSHAKLEAHSAGNLPVGSEDNPLQNKIEHARYNLIENPQMDVNTDGRYKMEGSVPVIKNDNSEQHINDDVGEVREPILTRRHIEPGKHDDVEPINVPYHGSPSQYPSSSDDHPVHAFGAERPQHNLHDQGGIYQPARQDYSVQSSRDRDQNTLSVVDRQMDNQRYQGQPIQGQTVHDRPLVQSQNNRIGGQGVWYDQSDDRGRSYCATRAGESCCVGRNDGCSVPFHDTLCYCDLFCDRTGTDCCPDFVAACGALLGKEGDSSGKDVNGLSSGRDDLKNVASSYRYPDQRKHGDKVDGFGGKDNFDNKDDYGRGDGHWHKEGEKASAWNNSNVDKYGQDKNGIGNKFGANSLEDSGYSQRTNDEVGRNHADGSDPSGGRSDWEYDQGVSDNGRHNGGSGSAYGSGVDGSTVDNAGSNEGFRGYQAKTIDGLPNNCYHRGTLHHPGDGIKENCNNCTCVNAVLKKEYNWKCTQKICLIRPELLDHVSNSPDCGWKAQNYSFLWGLSAEEGMRYKLGTLKPSDSVNRMTMLNVRVDDKLPDQFDARDHWPGLISPVMDQGFCASSWAISTAGVASDRLRIHSGGFYGDVTLSSQQLVSCDTEHDQHGCSSGHVDRAWWFMRKIGLVSDQCYPYTSAGSRATLAQGSITEPACLLPRSYEALKTAQCTNPGVPLTVYRASPPYKIAPNEREIMKELMTNGPLQAIMEVKEDFYMYKSGVYSFSLPAEYQTYTERNKRHHSVRIVGWGVDRSNPSKEVKYWICANSWGLDWGEDGYFKILRGADESSIESHVVGVWLKVNDRMLIQRRTGGGGARGAESSRRRLVRHPRRQDRLLHQKKREERINSFRRVYQHVH